MHVEGEGSSSRRNTFARRDLERAIAFATPRNARHGMILGVEVIRGGAERKQRKRSRSTPRPQRTTRVNKDVFDCQMRQVVRVGRWVDLVAICIDVV